MKLILREGIVCILENGEEDLQFSLFAEKMQADCEAVWHAGWQLCNAESLTGKPCCMFWVQEVVNFGGGPEFGLISVLHCRL